MGTLLGKIFRWFLGKTGLLLVLIVALLLVQLVAQMKSIASNFDLATIDQDVNQRIGTLAPSKNRAREDIDKKLGDLREARTKKENARESLKSERCLLPTCGLRKDGDLYKVDLEIEFLTQAITYSEILRDGPRLCKRRKNNSDELERLRKVDAQLNSIRPWLAPISAAHQKIKDDIVVLQMTLPRLNIGCSKFTRISENFEGARSQQHTKKYALLVEELNKLKDAKSALIEAVKQVFPVALTILAGIVFMPMLVGAIAYYCVAPIASKGFGVQLLPESSGELSLLKKSDYVQEIDIDKDWELLVDSAWVIGKPDSVSGEFKGLLDKKMPLMSIVSGLYLITRFRSDKKSTISISAAPAVPNSSAEVSHANKIAVLDLPANASMVLQPRCLAGIVQHKEQPMRITRHWRIANLSSWLTLQLRYVVFHGPAKLIVRGNDGVNIGPAESGVTVNQSSILGFSANLKYAVSRSTPFYAYLSGKQQLFDDRFSSGPGFYIREVTPKPMKGVWFSNPITTIINTIIKALGG